MGLGQGEYGDILILSIGSIAVLLTVGTVMLLRGALKSLLSGFSSASFGGAKSEAQQAAESLSETLNILREKLEALEPLSVEYHNVLHDAGWGEISATMADLTAAEEAIRLLLQSRRYDDAFGLSAFLLEALPEDMAAKAAERFDEFAHLDGWQARTRDQLFTILDRATAAAKAADQIKIQRQHSPRATLETLAELRKFLNDLQDSE